MTQVVMHLPAPARSSLSEDHPGESGNLWEGCWVNGGSDEIGNLEIVMQGLAMGGMRFS